MVSKLIFLLGVLAIFNAINASTIGLEKFNLINQDSVTNDNLKFSWKSCGEDSDSGFRFLANFSSIIYSRY